MKNETHNPAKTNSLRSFVSAPLLARRGVKSVLLAKHINLLF